MLVLLPKIFSPSRKWGPLRRSRMTEEINLKGAMRTRWRWRITEVAPALSSEGERTWIKEGTY